MASFPQPGQTFAPKAPEPRDPGDKGEDITSPHEAFLGVVARRFNDGSIGYRSADPSGFKPASYVQVKRCGVPVGRPCAHDLPDDDESRTLEVLRIYAPIVAGIAGRPDPALTKAIGLIERLIAERDALKAEIARRDAEDDRMEPSLLA